MENFRRGKKKIQLLNLRNVISKTMETKKRQKNIRGTETAARRDVTGPEMSSTHKDVKAWEQLPGTRGRSPRSPLGLTGQSERPPVGPTWRWKETGEPEVGGACVAEYNPVLIPCSL